MIDGLPLLYWRRNLGKSEQDLTLSNVLNTIRLCNPGATKSHTPLDNTVSLGNRIAYDFGRDRTTVRAIVLLPNITPQLWHDVIPQQIEWQNQLITYDATKMDGAYSDGIINNTPLFHQIFVNM